MSVQSYRQTFQVFSRYDPTRTTMLRNRFARDMINRFSKICGLIRKAVVDEDCFGLERPRIAAHQETPGWHAFDFPHSSDKITAFMAWLDQQVRLGVLDVSIGAQIGSAIQRAWYNTYVQSAYGQGVLRARGEMIAAGYEVPVIEATGGLAMAMSGPFHADRLGLIYTRTYTDLKGITDAMDQQLSRILTQGISEGRNPREIARLLTRTITGPSGDLSLTDTLGRFIPAERRAEMLARTEIIRAHHQATIQEYRNWAVVGVKVKAEFVTAGDDRVCDECSELEGKVYDLDEAENLIPVHPSCRCTVIPLDVTDEKKEAA